jgi:hypothetical protein
MNAKFKLGDRVRKRDGDEYPGIVVSSLRAPPGRSAMSSRSTRRFRGSLKSSRRSRLSSLPRLEWTMSETILEQIKARPYSVLAVILAVVCCALLLGMVLGWLPFG